MTARLDPSRAPFLADPRFRRLVAALDVAGDETRVVGGAVRNALLGLPAADLDLATTAEPDTVIARARAAGLKPVPTGYEHGTVTVVVEGHPFEVTTLRQDVETDGRHAVVRFGRDWAADAERRDFTINALSVTADGIVHDYVDGLADLAALRVRFIGDPDQRVREDYLRILRFFRFHAIYAAGDPDADGLAAAIRNRDGLDRISVERISAELAKLMAAPRAEPTLILMQEIGLLPRLLAGVARPARLGRLVARAAADGVDPGPALRLAALAGFSVEDAVRLSARLRLSKAERDRMAAVLALDPALTPDRLGGAPADRRTLRHLLYRAGPEVYRAAVRFAWADRGAGAGWAAALAIPETDPVPAFPVTGKDLIRAGLKPGPGLGKRLKEIEAAWIAADFDPAVLA